MTDTDMGGLCSCDWDESPEVYRRQERKAAKEHKCCECRKPINKGERYEYVTAHYRGGPHWYEFKTHLSCAGIRRDFCCNTHEGVDEMFEANFGFSPWEVPTDDEESC